MPSNAIPESRRYLLDQPVLAHMATTGPKGEPHNNPVWFLWKDRHLIVSIGPAGQKARNLQRDPRAAFSIADADRPESYLEMRGTAVDWQTVSWDDPTVVAIVRKYTGNDTYVGEPDEHTLVTFEPARWTTME